MHVYTQDARYELNKSVALIHVNNRRTIGHNEWGNFVDVSETTQIFLDQFIIY